MIKVAILMSTYNGEKYLMEQLDSLFEQENILLDVYVRDDQSNDNTLDILDNYAKKNNHLIIQKGNNVGVGNSFMNLLYSVPNNYDYYAFADQDDIWNSKKIISAINLLENSNKVLYASNQESVDKYGNSLGFRYNQENIIHVNTLEILNRNDLAGCTMVFKKRLFEILKDEKNRPSEGLLKNRIHDVWVAIVATVNGGIIYDERSFIKYRQHEDNVVGADTTSIKKKIKLKIKKLTNAEERNGRSKLANELVNKFPNYNYCESMLASSNIKKMSNKLFLIKNKDIRNITNESFIGFALKIMLNLY